ncbi:MAG: sensor histidine kinase [Crocinitomicaceae bacterium]|nr:sensor histidine kinase [Crocinitomicaceae bacterium]
MSDLAEDLKMIFQTEKKIDVHITSTYGEIDLKTLVPLGLLLNELISNSYKYAFNAVAEGEIKIAISENQDKFDLIYSDNGT